MRLARPALAAALALAWGGAAASAGDATGEILAQHDELRRQILANHSDERALAGWHRLRHAPAMVDLVAQLPAAERPRRLLYLAAGAHLAPLALCELLPPGDACRLAYTDADPDAADAIRDELADLGARGRLAGLAEGGGSWRFELSGHPVELILHRVRPGPVPRVDPALLAEADLVITHDWSGDPIENLRVLLAVLEALRATASPRRPLVMMEDLERHPYPIDLELFSPVARTRAQYGHRGPLSGAAAHPAAERGIPLFGGAVLLGLADGWWREVSPKTVQAVADLLLFSDFLEERRNVLEGGGTPLLAPALLDWWTGFGSRTVAGGDLRSVPGGLAAIAREAAAAAAAMTPDHRRRLACRLQLLRTTAHAAAAGAGTAAVMPPAASSTQTPRKSQFPNDEMESLYREALRHAGAFREAQRRAPDTARELAAALDAPGLHDLLGLCPVDEPAEDDDPLTVWLGASRQLAGELRAH